MLAPFFQLPEFTRTRTYLPNTPPAEAIARLRALCSAVLVPWRERVGGPLVVTSGYRSPEVNAAVLGHRDSQHQLGEAADLRPQDRLAAWAALLGMIEAGFPVDQAILYESSSHIHVSHSARHVARRGVLVKTGPKGEGRYIPWDKYDGPLLAEYTEALRRLSWGAS